MRNGPRRNLWTDRTTGALLLAVLAVGWVGPDPFEELDRIVVLGGGLLALLGIGRAV